MHSVYLLRDNETVAGEQDLVRDHEPGQAHPLQGHPFPDTWWDGQGMCAMYFHEGAVTGQRGGSAGATMNMVLRPGEALAWRWSQCEPVKHHGALQTMPTYPSLIYNGLWEYRPDFSKETWRNGASSVENITSGPDGLAAEEGKTGASSGRCAARTCLWGGRLEAESAAAKFSVSVDGKTWERVKDNLDKFFSTVGPARYEYKLQVPTGRTRPAPSPGDHQRRADGALPCRRWPWARTPSPILISPPAMITPGSAGVPAGAATPSRKVRITHQLGGTVCFAPTVGPASSILSAGRRRAQWQ